MSIRTIIVDDEPLARRGLELRLRETADVEIVRQCANGREALAAINELQPDLMFLDIQMPGMSGFDVVKQVPQESLPMIVFVTAFDRFAIEAFEAQAPRLEGLHMERAADQRDLVPGARQHAAVIASHGARAEHRCADGFPVRHRRKYTAPLVTLDKVRQ